MFSSDTLVDGETLVATHAYENMDEKQLQAELDRLKDQIDAEFLFEFRFES